MYLQGKENVKSSTLVDASLSLPYHWGVRRNERLFGKQVIIFKNIQGYLLKRKKLL